MFTGIIEELGTVETLEHHGGAARVTLRSPRVLEGISLGDSIAVSGCCLTVTAQDGRTWSADIITTTLDATTLGTLSAGDRVNLERCVRADARLDGHIVQGHVDAVAEIAGREEGDGTTLLRLNLPAGLERYVVDKGSIAVDGISLTVAGIEAGVVTIGLIPETLERTTLGTKQVGDVVNLEVDVLAKYVEKLSASLLPGAEVRR
ncbi:riboflavin synthase subunit alpha [Brachybacterium sp. P6-10-X1]|uniref:riboflavin synthase n=1 Tax=Brachybacterium sp. P6-10-X1 TaxID=1903186 RepID=UPI0009718EF3|nr:riboflavin synthase [Brachybacterium sp. P6-10-X1]APX33520.1 riboflavin synthase subunit alpha [Brachybacterium sp. P6-10-X1]